MKKTLISTLMAAGLIASAGTASAADTGTIKFQGSITESACSISGANTNMTVAMGSVAKHEFQAVGDRNTTGADFSISLLNCDTSVYGNATISFSPSAGSVVDGRMLSLENANGAKGVAIALFDEANDPIIVGSTGQAKSLMDGTNQFNFKAFYEATAAAVEAGPANGSAIFEVTYS